MNGNDPVSLRFAGHVVNGVVVPESDFSHLKLPNCAFVEIVVDADLVSDETVRRAMLSRTSTLLLPVGTTVVATVSDCVGGSDDVRRLKRVTERDRKRLSKYLRAWRRLKSLPQS